MKLLALCILCFVNLACCKQPQKTRTVHLQPQPLIKDDLEKGDSGLEQRVRELESLLEQEQDNQKELQAEIDALNAKETKLEKLENLHERAWEQMKRKVGSQNVELSEHGCVADVLDLRCPDNTTMFVMRAQYGQYASCAEGCCQPDISNDCISDVKDNNNEAWTELRLFCNYQTACQYQYQGSQHTVCEALLADYLRVTYTCVGAESEMQQSIGFTAGHRIGTFYYTSDTVLYFDYIITNIGNHYDYNFRRFTCPVDGMYYFYVSITNTNEIYSRLEKDGAVLMDIQTYPKGATEWYNDYWSYTVSNSVVTRCLPGQKVYVITFDYWNLYSADYDDSSFSGFLISEF